MLGEHAYPPAPSLSPTEIISHLHDNILHLQNNITHPISDPQAATQKAETRISCNTIAIWSSYFERNADIDNCLEAGLGLGLGFCLGADASPEICTLGGNKLEWDTQLELCWIDVS